ncbi:MAG: hypothetical protein Q7R31_04940 [Candidatus Levybacteria bacterium]|nr:hypothetical protein [Candidatus Levybacteria bacterium]
MEKLEQGESWNKKRIFLTLLVIIALLTGAFGIKNFVLGNNTLPKESPIISALQSVKGAVTQEELNAQATKINPPAANLPVQKIVQDQLEVIQQEVKNLNVADITSSSPQVKKIIEDLQSLQDYPRNQAKDVCTKICSGL